MKQNLIETLEIEKRLVEKIKKSKEFVLPHFLVQGEDGKFKIIYVVIEDKRNYPTILSEWLRRLLLEKWKLFIFTFEARMKKIDCSEGFEKALEKYRYGELQNDVDAIDCIVIWGIEKDENYRTFRIYEVQDESLKLVEEFENEEFDKVCGRLSFLGGE
ncbi:MAG: hypothetical protein QXG39_00300 [Candidatus Aenigmatarchaeota archaeon]